MKTVTMEEVIFKKLGREAAKRRYVLRDHELFKEFLDENPDIEKMGSKIFCEKLDEFIEKKNIRIVSEHINPRETETKYVIDVDYLIDIG